jgi:hypothetical protein
MVKYETRNGVEYVLREGVTIDDPVGKYMLKGIEENGDARTRVGGRGARYLDLIEDFENGNMTAEIYRSLLKRTKFLSKSQRQVMDEREARAFFKSDLVRLIYGERGIEGLSENDLMEMSLVEKNPSQKKDYIKKVVFKKLEKMPKIDDFNSTLRDCAERGELKQLERLLGGLKSYIKMSIDMRFSMLRYGDPQLYEQFRLAFNSGNVFNLANVFGEVAKKYPSGYGPSTRKRNLEFGGED